MIDDLTVLSRHFLKQGQKTYQRSLAQSQAFNRPCTVIIGQRGVGKTTLVLQHLHAVDAEDTHSPTVLYVPCDHYLTQDLALYEIAEDFHLRGGRVLCFDEIHKSAGWAKQIKSILDTFKDLRVIVTGSSALEIEKATHDLSRRVVCLELFGLSLREFIALETGIHLATCSLKDLLKSHVTLAEEITATLSKAKQKIIGLFEKYLSVGYLPYYQEYTDPQDYYLTLQQNLDRTLEGDLLAIHPALTGNSIRKIRRLATRLSENVPYTPDMRKLARQLTIGDERTLYDYLTYLEKTRIIKRLPPRGSLTAEMTKPEKIYLDNPNLMAALAHRQRVDRGSLRETFFYSAVAPVSQVTATHPGDFLLDKRYTFEIGGKTKTFDQIKAEKDAYLAIDSVEIGSGRRIPLWLFGFLY